MFRKHADLLHRNFEKLRMRSGVKKLAKRCADMRKKLLARFDQWRYTVLERKPFQRFLKMFIIYQKSVRFKFMVRTIRKHLFQRQYISGVLETMVSRAKYLDLIHKAQGLAKTRRFFRYVRFIRAAREIKKLLWNLVNQDVWPQILQRIRTMASLKIQKTIRGHLIRVRYPDEREHMRIFRIDLFKNKGARYFQKVYRGYSVRKKIAKFAAAAVMIQKKFRGHQKLKAFTILKKATVIIQNFWRLFSFTKYRFSELLGMQKIDAENTFAEANKRERAVYAAMNYVEDMSFKDRGLRFNSKRAPEQGFVDSRSSFTKRRSHTAQKKGK